MATKTVRVSDLTGNQIQEEQSSVRLIVEHPDYPEPIGLDVLPDEVLPHLSEENSRFIVVSLEDPDNPNPQRYVMSSDNFERLFATGDSTSVLQQVITSQQQERERQPRRGGRRQGDGRRGQRTEPRKRLDYASPEHAGLPHRGTVSEGEREYVRNNLEEVNRRRQEQGHRAIDPTDPQMAERYGLASKLIEDAEVVDETPPEQ